MVGVKPGAFFGGEESWLNQVQIDGREAQCFETVHVAFGAGDVAFFDENEVFDANAPLACFVKAGLIGQHHAGFERGDAGFGDALGAFMDGEVGADAVAGAVVEIEPDVPKRLAGESVELCAGDTFREHGDVNRDMALEHAGEAVFHFGGCGADDDGAGDVGGAILVLRAGIDQENALLDAPIGVG